MSIRCIKKCVEGDILVIPDPYGIIREYRVTQRYIDEFYLTSKLIGYILIRDVSTLQNTFICGRNLVGITKIIKKTK